MQINSLQDLFLHTLQDVYFAENHITKQLPKMASQAQAQELKQAFQQHLTETQGQIKRLDQVFQALGQQAKGEECPAILGITTEAEELLGQIQDADTKDAALIAAAQAVEHYEITRYGALVAWARELGQQDLIQHLEQTLNEEKKTDALLTQLAEARVNRKAA